MFLYAPGHVKCVLDSDPFMCVSWVFPFKLVVVSLIGQCRKGEPPRRLVCLRFGPVGAYPGVLLSYHGVGEEVARIQRTPSFCVPAASRNVYREK